MRKVVGMSKMKISCSLLKRFLASVSPVAWATSFVSCKVLSLCWSVFICSLKSSCCQRLQVGFPGSVSLRTVRSTIVIADVFAFCLPLFWVCLSRCRARTRIYWLLRFVKIRIWVTAALGSVCVESSQIRLSLGSRSQDSVITYYQRGRLESAICSM